MNKPFGHLYILVIPSPLPMHVCPILHILPRLVCFQSIVLCSMESPGTTENLKYDPEQHGQILIVHNGSVISPYCVGYRCLGILNIGYAAPQNHFLTSICVV